MPFKYITNARYTVLVLTSWQKALNYALFSARLVSTGDLRAVLTHTTREHDGP